MARPVQNAHERRMRRTEADPLALREGEIDPAMGKTVKEIIRSTSAFIVYLASPPSRVHPQGRGRRGARDGVDETMSPG